MPSLSVLAWAFALAMDAFAASIAIGTVLPAEQRRYALRPAALFGIFQAGMTAAGWWLGGVHGFHLRPWVAGAGAFAILLLLGGKMIWEGLHVGERVRRLPRLPELLGLALATSVDALGAGVSMRLVDHLDIFTTTLWIGFVTAVLSGGGVAGGSILAERLGRRPLILGGSVLVALGVKSLVDMAL